MQDIIFLYHKIIYFKAKNLFILKTELIKKSE